MTSKDTADAYPFRTLPPLLRFTIAMAAVVSVFLIDRFGGDLVDDASHFLLLGSAVLATAWFAGTGPALAATVLGAVMGAAERGAPSNPHPSSPVHMALFVGQALLLTGAVRELRAARRSAERETVDAQSARRAGEAANRMKDEFLATVSHELRTPLNAVLGWVHLLRTGKLDVRTTARGLETVERNVRLQAQLTGDLLDVSRALTGKLQIESRPAALGEAAELAAATARSLARAKRVTIAVDVPSEPVVVMGDPDRLRQIVWHLLTNAIKFSSLAAVIEVHVDREGDQARITVEDRGTGIDPEFLPRIFDHFTQADSSATRAVGGLGVGLALVRELVELQGGTVEAKNRGDGRGAIFTVSFPVYTGALPATPGIRDAVVGSGAGPSLAGLRVLVLDEDREALEVVDAVLQQQGATVKAVSSVAEALESLEAWAPDVLVSDRSTPDHDSYALVSKVHRLDAERGGRIPAAALTRAARSDERLSRLLAGAQSDVPKPIEPGLLAAEIARLSGRERRRARR